MRSFRPVAAAFVTAVTLSSCGGDSTSPPAPHPTSITVGILGPTTMDALGVTAQLTPTVRDQNGNVLDRHVTWTSDAPSVATVSLGGEVAAVGNGVAHVTGTIGTISAERTFTVAQVPIYMFTVSGDSQTTALNTPLGQPLVVHVTDRLNHDIPSTVVSFSILAGGGTLDAIADTTDSSGIAMDRWTAGTKAGTAIVGASQRPDEGLRFTETVTPGPASAVARGAGDRQTAFPSAPLADSVAARVVDAYGNPVAGVRVVFQVATGGGSVSPASATSGADGDAWTHWTLGATVGSQTLQASATGLTGSPVTFTATASSLAILAVAPDTLVEGNTATISGQGFDPVPANDVVTIDGDAAIVTAATTTQLTVTVPAFDCKPARAVNVGVTVGAATAVPAAAPVRPASYLSVGVGQQVIVRPPSNLCLQFAASGTSGDSYLIGVGAAAESPGALNAVVLSGARGLGASASRFAIPSLSAAPASGGAPISPSPLQQEVARRWERQ
ncbi:MAG: Ig-like domain-containing protein, partial [Gemmatimonadaceae bacterium]